MKDKTDETATESNTGQLKLLCRTAPFGMILSGVPIFLGLTSQEAQGTMMATINTLGIFAGFACFFGSVFMYVAALLRLKSINAEQTAKAQNLPDHTKEG